MIVLPLFNLRSRNQAVDLSEGFDQPADLLLTETVSWKVTPARSAASSSMNQTAKADGVSQLAILFGTTFLVPQ
jgi:hypothetical protein